MPFSWLDIILIAVMLLSALLAMMRGLTREVLSISSWGVAAAAAFFTFRNPAIKAIARSYVTPENSYIADIGLVVGVFFIVLIIMSLLTVKLSDRILDSRVGALDRTLGFVFGLARGLLIVAVAFLFYSWLIPKDRHFVWIKHARTLPVINKTSNYIISFLPPDTADALLGRRARPAEPQGQAAPDTGSGGTDDTPAPKTEKKAGGGRNAGYRSTQRNDLNRLVEGTAKSRQ